MNALSHERMIRVGRHSTAIEHLSPSGVPVRLVGEVWWIARAQNWGGGAYAYHRPRYVDSGGSRAPIIDFLGLARMLVLVLLGGLLLRRITS